MLAFDELFRFDTTNLRGGLNYIEARSELIQVYDEDYGIESGHEHIDMTKQESLTSGSLFEYWAEIYDQFKIWDRFHISFDSYIDRPSFLMESLNQTAERLNKKDIDLAEKIKQEAEREKQKLNSNK